MCEYSKNELSLIFLLKNIYQDLKINYKNGLFCFLFLLLYRCGRFFYCLHMNSLPPIRWFFLCLIYFFKVLMKPFSFIYGCFIPLKAKIGERVVFRHAMFGIFLSSSTEIGNDVVIFHQVTIGSNFDTHLDPGAPKIGNNVFIGCGAKIIGKVTIGDHVNIGSNAVVVNDIPPNSTVVCEKSRIISRSPKSC